jgi:hypothetical protein
MTPGAVFTDGTRIVAVSAKVVDDYDAAVDLSVSTDSGRTWSDIPGSSLPFLDASEVAETAGGTLFVGGGQGLIRSTDASWTHFAKVSDQAAWALQPLDDGRMGVLAGYLKRNEHLVAVDDVGRMSPYRALGDATSGPSPTTSTTTTAAEVSSGY